MSTSYVMDDRRHGLASRSAPAAGHGTLQGRQDPRTQLGNSASPCAVVFIMRELWVLPPSLQTTPGGDAEACADRDAEE